MSKRKRIAKQIEKIIVRGFQLLGCYVSSRADFVRL